MHFIGRKVFDSGVARPVRVLQVFCVPRPCRARAARLALLLAATLLVGCERSIEARCATEPSEACCLLSSAEAEAPLSLVVQEPSIVHQKHWSRCRYEAPSGEFAELDFFPEGGRHGTFAAEMRRVLETNRLERVQRLAVPNFTATAFWVEDAAFPTGRGPVLFVIDGDDFFRVAATPLGQGFPAWKRPRELARSVLRNLAARRQTSPAVVPPR